MALGLTHTGVTKRLPDMVETHQWAAVERSVPQKQPGEGAVMEANRQTLLAKLAPLFGPRTENLAVEALGHVLSGSTPARRALSDLLRAGGADLGKIARVRTQATGDGGERPDLVGMDQKDGERLLIEAKFWAGLTDNQPVSYLRRLAPDGGDPCALLFIAPAARLEPLWNELLRLAREAGPSPKRREDAIELRSAEVGESTFLVLTSWRNLLHRMAAQVSAAGESHTETDIRQLHGLAEQQDDEAFLPLRREEFGPEFPRRLLNLRRLVDDATDRARSRKILGTEGLKVTPWADGYGRYVRIVDQTPWFGIHHGLWAGTYPTPLWLCFWDGAPESVKRCDDIQVFNGRDVPIDLPVGKEFDLILDAAVKRLERIGRLIT